VLRHETSHSLKSPRGGDHRTAAALQVLQFNARSEVRNQQLRVTPHSMDELFAIGACDLFHLCHLSTFLGSSLQRTIYCVA